MLQASLVINEDELIQINQLNKQNIKGSLSEEEKEQEGFVSWLYSLELLKKMDGLAPSVIVKDGQEVVGYALTTVKESTAFHNDLKLMVDNLQTINYKDKPLTSFNFYFMGQICIAKEYRGKGVFNLLYQKHKEAYKSQYDLLITEVSTSNIRSQKAHEKVGFKTIYTYRDASDEWNVIVWDWGEEM